MGWLVRIALSEVSSEDEAEMVASLAKLNDRKPEWVRAMREMSRVDTRRALREQGLSLADLPGEVYMVNCPDELIDVPQRYGIKLAKALYYLHTGRIVPRTGFVKVRALTNAEFMSPKFPLDGFKMLSSRPVLTRAGKSLEDQFAYRYGVASDAHAAGFLMQFRESTAIVALVYEDAARRLEGIEKPSGSAAPR